MTISFPIAFSVIPYLVIPQYQVYSTSGFASGWLYVNSKSNSSFTMQWQGTYVWFAIGIQQWGHLTSTNKNKTTSFDMPLSVNVVYHLTMEAVTHRGDNAFVNGHAFVSHNGGSNVTIGESDYGSGKWWMSICQAQQWGKLQSSKIFTYPLVLNTLYTYHQEFYEGYIHWTTEAPSCEATLSTITVPDAPYPPAAMYFLVIGKQQWGIWNDNRSAGRIQCTFPVSKAKETLAISATYFDNTDVSNGAILIKETTLSTCKIKLWSYTKISFWMIGYQSYNSISYCSPKSIYVSRT